MTETSHPDSVTVRRALPTDMAAVHELAALDSAPPPAGELLVAVRDGRPLAALSIETGAAVADPFAATGELVDLLRLRLRQLRGAEARSGFRGLRALIGVRA